MQTCPRCNPTRAAPLERPDLQTAYVSLVRLAHRGRTSARRDLGCPERERERERDTDRDRETQRERERERGKRDRERERERDTESERETDRQI